MIYVVCLLDGIGGLGAPLFRRGISRLVPSTQQGEVLAGFAAVELLCQLAAGVLYNSVYEVTVHSFPGAFAAMAGCSTLMCAVVVFIASYVPRDAGSLPALGGSPGGTTRATGSCNTIYVAGYVTSPRSVQSHKGKRGLRVPLRLDQTDQNPPLEELTPGDDSTQEAPPLS